MREAILKQVVPNMVTGNTCDFVIYLKIFFEFYSFELILDLQELCKSAVENSHVPFTDGYLCGHPTEV
jgi:hypothetical protein